MPLVEISLSKGGLTPEEQLRLSKAVHKALIEEYKKIKGRDTAEKKEKYPELPMQMQVVGPTVIFTIIFLVAYLLVINLGWLS